MKPAATVKQLVAAALNARTERARWKRVTALHGLGTLEVFEAAKELMLSTVPDERHLGAEVLGQLGYRTGHPFQSESEPVLAACLESETDPLVIGSALIAAGHLELWKLLARETRLASHPSKSVRISLAQALATAPNPCPEELVALMIRLSSDDVGDVRDWACFALGSQSRADGVEVRNALADRLGDPHRVCRAEAVLGLARRRDDRALGPCLKALSQRSVEGLTVEAAAFLARPDLLPALRALAAAGWNWDAEVLATALERCDPAARMRADRRRRTAFVRFESNIRRRLATGQTPGIVLRSITLTEDPDDYYRLSDLRALWNNGSVDGETRWDWEALMARAGSRTEPAARLAAQDVLVSAMGASE